MKQLTKVALFCLYDRTDDDLEFAQSLAEEGYSFMGSPNTLDWLESHQLRISHPNNFPDPFCSAHERLHFSPEALKFLQISKSDFIKSGYAMDDLPFIDPVYIKLFPLEEEMRREGSGEDSIRRKTERDGLTAMMNALNGGRIVISKQDPAFFKDVLTFIRQRDTLSPEKEKMFMEIMKGKAAEAIQDYDELCNNYHKSNRIAETIGHI